MASTNITRTCTAGNRRKWTWSAWIKRTATGTEENLFTGYESSTTYTELKFNASDELQYQNRISNTWSGELKTNRKFRDTSAWYHIVIVWDSENTNSAAQRMRMYINGVEESSFATRQNPSNPTDSSVNWASRPLIYGGWGQNSRYFNGCMSHIHFIDGTVYSSSDFGETDSTTGEWKIKTSVSVTYGTNGSFILKDGNSLTDQSGESNNFSAGTGTLTKTEDCPSNVFATLNSLYKDGGSAITYSNGNNTCNVGSGDIWCTSPSTLGTTSGKFYFEGKFTLNSGTEGYIGIAQDGNLNVKTNTANYLGIDNFSIGYYSGNGKYYRNTNSFTYGDTYTTGDIVGCAVDIDNKKIYFSKNGVWQNSGDPTSGATGTGAIDVSSYFVTGDPYFLCFSPNQSKYEANFGNGYFGTTAVSSAGTNASGIGIFEYDVPTGYTALSTKGLNL